MSMCKYHLWVGPISGIISHSVVNLLISPTKWKIDPNNDTWKGLTGWGMQMKGFAKLPQVSLEASLKRSDGSMFKQSLVRTVGLD